MAEFNRAQMQAWEASLQLASKALAFEGAGLSRLRGRLRNTMSALRESVELVRRLIESLATAQHQLADQKARMSGLVEHLPVPYVLTLGDGTIVGLNTAASTVLNVSARALIGRNLLVFLDDRQGWAEILSEVAVSGAAVRRAGKLRPRERVQESVIAVLSASYAADGAAIQWFVMTEPEHLVQGVPKCTPTRGSRQSSPPSS